MKDFEVFFKNSSSVVLLIDAVSGAVADANPAAVAFHGGSYQDMIARNVFDISNYTPAEIEQQMADILSGKISDVFYRHQPDGKELKDIQASVSPVVKDGKQYILAILKDISQLKIAEEESSRLKKISANIPGVVYQYKLRPDGSSCFPYASEAIKKIYNVSPEEVREDASTIFKVLHPDDIKHVTDTIQQSAQTLSEWRDEYRVILNDNKEHWLLGNAIPEKENDGSVLWHGFITDITQLKQLERELLLTKEQNEMAIDQAQLTYWHMSGDMRSFTFNDRFYKLYDTTAEQEGGYIMPAVVYAREFLFEEDVHLVQDAITKFEADEKKSQMQLQHRIKTRKGNIKYIDVRINGLFNRAGELVGTYGCNQDITENRKKEEEILRLNAELKELTGHLQRLRAEERNKLALEVHDKLGQRLVGMKLEIDYLKGHVHEQDEVVAGKIQHVSNEIGAMLKDFNAIYSQVNPSFIDDLHLIDIIDSLVTEHRWKNKLQVNLSTNIENEKFSHETKWNVYKILEECLHNASAHSNAQTLSVKVYKQDELLQIEVEDDGAGFDASGTTMHKQIGIIEMRERVNTAGGIMVIDAAEGRGTCIKITISNL